MSSYSLAQRIFFFLLISSSSFASTDGVFQFLKTQVLQVPELKAETIREVLSHRCQKYLPASGARCKALAADLYLALSEKNVTFNDPVVHRARTNTVCFTETLIDLVRRPEVYQFLKELNQKLSDSAWFNFEFWPLALKHAKDRASALGWVSALFQDTTLAQSHIQFLRQSSALKTHVGAQATVHQLSTALTRLDALDPQQVAPSVSILPVVVPNFLTKGYYHFYVPAQVASVLVAKGYSRTEAFFSAFLLNYLYEVFDLEQGELLNLFYEPNSVDPPDSQFEIQLGYLGALFGIDENRFVIDQDLFTRFLAVSPEGLLKWLGRIKQ